MRVMIKHNLQNYNSLIYANNSMKSMSGEIHDAKLVRRSLKGSIYKINNWYFGDDMLEFIEEMEGKAI